jgi:hypothetical protein
LDNDGVPSLSVADVSVTEGAGSASFTVSLSAASGSAVTVAYATSNGTAVAGSDYTATSGTLSFAVGITSRTVAVPVTPDTLDEVDETFNLVLSAPVGATLADATGVGTIVDDDALPTLAVADVSVTEGAGSAVFTVSLSALSGRAVTVAYATANGTATAGSDYTATSGSLSFAAGTRTLSVTVPVLGDALAESTESFLLNLTSPVNATLADAQATGTIVDDDGALSLSVADVGVTEGSSGTVNARFTVTLSAASSSAVTVAYATSNGTAVAGSDYTATSGRLTFAAGATSRTVVVPVISDLADEPDETMSLVLSAPVGATLADATALGTIVDDDAPPTLSVSNARLSEGAARLAFTVSLTPASGKSVTVTYATANATALAGSDYTATSGTLTFAPGSRSAVVNVPILADLTDEPNETLTLNLSAPVNATLLDAQGLGTILDDDAPSTLSVADVQVTEGTGSSVSAAFVVSLSRASALPITVNYGTANRTAMAGQDYTATSGSLTFPAGTTSQTVSVPILGDTLAEAAETLLLRLALPANATLARATAVATINDND